MPSLFQAWLLAARPRTLPASVAPVALGCALAFSQNCFHVGAACLALLVSFCLQIGVNLANDYFDGMAGLDTDQRLGPVRATAGGLIAPASVKRGMIVCFALSACLGLFLVFRAGWPVVVIGVLSVLAALAYSGGPYPLASNGLGDVFSFLFYGPVAVCGTYFVQALHLPLLVLALSLPTGLLVAAILVVNNYRDIETDKNGGKRTLAVMIGPGASRAQFFSLITLSYLLLPVFWLGGVLGSGGVLLPLCSLPLAVVACRGLQRETGKMLNVTLGQTALLALLFSLLLAVGILISGAHLFV